MRRVLPLLFLSLAAQAADFPTPYNSEQGQGEPMPAEEAARTMKLPPGFKAQVFAAEPDIQNPIACAWDRKGRLWVVENYTYAERSKRFDLALRDRLIILEDADNDGHAEKRTVFTDEVQMLTSVEVGRGGVWLMCPPQVLFIPDANEDGVPDGEPQVVLDGFTVAKDNYHNFANGLKWGPDGWLYGRCGHSCPGRLGVPGTPDEQRIPIKGGVWRYHPERKVVEVLTHGTTNPWGFDWDEHGEGFFINTVTGHLWHLIPGAHLVDSTSSNPSVYDRLDTIADHWHFDRSSGWQKSKAQNADALGGGHAHIGMMIYQADQWPEEWRNRLFTLNMHGKRANVEKLDRVGSGYVGRHQADTFFSKDPFFRGIEITTGPDGSAFILDYSDTGECHESTGVHRTSGRIYKISYGEVKKPDFKSLETPDFDSVVKSFKGRDEWFVRQLRLRLIDAKITAAMPSLPSTLWRVVQSEEGSVTRLRALWALCAMRVNANLFPVDLGMPISAQWRSNILGLLHDRDEHIRVWAIRILSDTWPLDTITGPPNVVRIHEGDVIDEFVRLARSDSSAMVRLALSSVLMRLHVSDREALALALVAHADDANDYALPSMVWYGIMALGDSDPSALVRIAKVCSWPDTLRWIAHSLAGRIDKDGKPLAALLSAATASQREAILQGISEGLQGWRKAPKPESWDMFAAAFTEPADKDIVRELSTVFGDGRALDEVKKTALDAKAAPAVREAALKTLIDNKPDDLRAICESLLDVRGLNATAARGLALFNDPTIGKKLAQSYRKFGTIERTAVIDTLVSRASFAKSLLDEVAAGHIVRTDITAFHARQIRSLNDADLTKQLADVWGELRDAGGDKTKLIAEFKAKLTAAELAKAKLGNGRLLFSAICGACHTLYGEGGKVGPDLTGSGRANLDYLLENIIDPSGVVSADFRMNIITLKDGRVLTGIIAGQTTQTLTVRLLAQETTVERTEITKQEVSPMSMMPEGLMLAFQPDQVRDLIAYLMHPQQVPLPK